MFLWSPTKVGTPKSVDSYNRYIQENILSNILVENMIINSQFDKINYQLQ